MSLFDQRPKTGNWFKDHSLGLFFSALFLGQLLIWLWLGAYTWTHEQPFENAALWSSEFWHWWFGELNLSIVADTYGVWVIIYASKWLYERGSSESS